MTPNFELIAHMLGDYHDLQADGVVEAANRFPLVAVEEQIQSLSQLEPAGNAVLANRIAELERDVSMHRNAEITWEQTMMQAVGEDGPKSVVEAIDNIKAERDTAWRELREIREAIGANPEESTADEVRRVVVERDALAAQIEVLQKEMLSMAAIVSQTTKALIEATETLERELLPALEDSDDLLSLISEFKSVAEATPSACLAQVRAKTVEEAANELGTLITAPAGMYSGAVVKLNRIAERIRQGGAE